jgi:hypothetical protein
MDPATGWKQLAIAGIHVARNLSFQDAPGPQVGELQGRIELHFDEQGWGRNRAMVTLGASKADSQQAGNQRQENWGSVSPEYSTQRPLRRYAQLLVRPEREIENIFLHHSPVEKHS